MTSTALSLPSKIDVIINGNKISLGSADVISSGGEGVVFKKKIGNEFLAIKIIYPSMRSSTRFEKLQKMLNRPNKTNGVVFPRHMIYDAKNEPIGYAMNYVDTVSYTPLTFWMKLWWRDNKNINNEQLFSVFLDILKIIKNLHAEGYIIGDMNPNGFLVLDFSHWNESNKNKRVMVVDVDSFQFDNYQCPVYTLEYLDYLIPKTVTKDGIYLPNGFTNKNDVFAFTAMLFESITGVNVYGGYHPSFGGILPKLNFEKGWTVINEAVEYPNGADIIPFEKLQTSFQKTFKDIFLKEVREYFPQNLLTGEMSSNVFETTIRQVSEMVSDRNVKNYRPILTSDNNQKFTILDLSVCDKTVHILYVSKESNKKVLLYATYYNDELKVYDTNYFYDSSQTYKIVGQYLVAFHVEKSQDETVKVTVFDVRFGHRYETITTTGAYSLPLFLGGFQGYFSSLNGTHLTKSGYENEYPRFVKSVSNNTMIKGDFNTDSIAGYSRVMSVYFWFFVVGGLSFDVSDIAMLEDTETLTSWSVRFYKNRALLIRFTEFKGEKRIRFDEVNLSENVFGSRIISSRISKSQFVSHPSNFEYVTSAQNQGLIFYATHRGLAKENLETGDIYYFENTKDIVKADMIIRKVGNGILVYAYNQVFVLEL